MIKKIEAWFRKIIQEEVTTVRDDFHSVIHRFEQEAEDIETKFGADLKKFEGCFEQEIASLENRVTLRLEELVTTTLERFDAKAQLIELGISKELDHWKTDEEVRKADEALRHPKPLKR